MVPVGEGEVARLNGRLLASRVDPVGEAKRWVERRRPFLNRVRGIFVLGIGSGYHVAELARETKAKILVIERHTELARTVTGTELWRNSRAQSVVAQSLTELWSNELLRFMVESSYLVLSHQPSRAAFPKFYAAAEKRLIARDPKSLRWLMELRGETAVPNMPTSGPLSIHHLVAADQSAQARRDMPAHALRGLVK